MENEAENMDKTVAELKVSVVHILLRELVTSSPLCPITQMCSIPNQTTHHHVCTNNLLSKLFDCVWTLS
jgi:hypothetical protein